MANFTAPLTPEMLAQLWQCSARHVRNLINNGQLRAFRLGGKLLRIPVEAVREFEQCQATELGTSAENSFSSSNRTESGGASGFTASGSGNISDTVTMPPASTITYKAAGMISASATGSISNTATVTAPAGVLDPNAANNSATATDTL